ncbi:hypothetical protein TrVE_jg9265 [Triparma verrucosa]|uniref:Dynein regulatory complex protein 9 n=1 Tax=Triparma verrucosa TaxID=1606542 RepID=A0A9W7BMU4_9STRA|nr:hypothetical protein TrVE_jg9265 [Triparma verrucosa]
MSSATSNLSSTHSVRTIAVLDECIEKLQFLGAIAPDVLSHRDELTAFVGGEISRIISTQRELENRYEKLITERGALKGLSNKTKYIAVQSEIQDVSHALRESTKSLCRNLKDNPNIAGNLVKIHRERTELIDILTSSIAELQESGNFDTLVSRVTSDKRSQEDQKEILRKERETAASVAQLDADLEAERSDHASIVSEQREEMAMLKEKLLSVRTEASVDVRFQRAEANANTGNILRSFRQVEAEMEAKIRELKEKLEVESTVNAESEKFLRKKQENLKAKLEEWNLKYDDDLEELTVKFNQLVKKREDNLEILVKLKKRRDQEIAEEKAKIAAEQTEKEAAAAAEKLSIKMDQAATYINAMVRRYLKRKAELAAAKGGKKGKKGGKKGKKK